MNKDKINEVQTAWGVTAAHLTPEEAVNAASEFLAMVLLSTMANGREVDCHEVLNKCTEASHEYINSNWREAQIAFRKALERAR